MIRKIKKNWFLTILIIFFALITGISFWNNSLKINADNVATDKHLTNELSGIVVDSSGKVYIGDGSNGVIDVYRSNGKYLHSLPTNTLGGYRMEIDDNDNIRIGLSREEELLIYDKNGKLVNTKTHTNEVGRIDDRIMDKYGNEDRFIDKEGNIYSLKQFSFFCRNRVVKTTPSGERAQY